MTLNTHSRDQIDAKLAGSPSKDLWTTYDLLTADFVRNPACWMYGVTGMEAMAAGWNHASLGHRFGLIMITDNIGISSGHAPSGGGWNDGTGFFFVINGEVVEVTVQDSINLLVNPAEGGLTGGATLDLALYLVDPAPGCTPVRIASHEWPSFCNGLIESALTYSAQETPIVRFDQDQHAETVSILSEYYAATIGNLVTRLTSSNLAITAPRSSYTGDGVVGASGKARGLVVQNEFILTDTSGAAAGTAVSWTHQVLDIVRDLCDQLAGQSPTFYLPTEFISLAASDQSAYRAVATDARYRLTASDAAAYQLAAVDRGAA